MNHLPNVVCLRQFVAAILTGALLGGCASSTQDLPETTEDGLVRVEGTGADAAYKAPDADFSVYDQVYIADVEVTFKKNWLREQNESRMGVDRRVTQQDADRIKAAIADEFSRIFTEELTAGGYQVYDPKNSTSASDDLMLLLPAIVNLDVNAPDLNTPDVSRTFTASAGQMTLYMEFKDSVTGTLLGRVMDTQGARDQGYLSVSNSVTNKAEADRILRRWAKLLVDRLNQVHGK